MRIPRWTLGAAVLAALAVGSGTRLQAQGVTTGLITGTVKTAQGEPLDNAQVQVTNSSTGFRAGVMSNSVGRYTVNGLEVGSNYTVTVRRIGFSPVTRNNVTVRLGQATQLDLVLSAQATQLGAVQVTAETQNSAISPSHTGAVTAISDSALRRLPTLNRNFTDFVALTPQVSTTSISGGLSGAGTNNRYNNVTIDGITEADVFGLGATGQPGGQANGKSIGLESVKEYQVLLSPYDVRQGNFAGIGINAVTKSGTNEFHGSVVGVTRNQAYARSQPYISKFKQSQYGVALGGPILKDKAFFFINPEFQTRTTPASGPYFGQAGVSLSQDRLDSLKNILANNYGFTNVGSAGIVNNENPLTNLFARLDFNLPWNTQLVLRDNYGSAQQDIFSRSNGTFSLSSNGYKFKSKKNAPAMQLRTLFSSGAYNEFLAGLTSIRDRRAPNAKTAQISVSTPGYGLVVGGERFSQGNELDQDIVEVTDNFTMPVRNHRITVGTQNQFMKFRNLFTQASYGVWSFNSLTSLNNGTPNGYTVGVPLSGDGAVRFKSSMFSGYVEDEWTVTPTFNVQIGVRADMPVFPDKPPYNLGADTLYGIKTNDFPSGNVEWSPRIGFNYDVTGDQANQLRGGIGMFTGRPAYVWLSNSFQNSGSVGVGVLTCPNNALPAFNTANLNSPPQQCTNGLTAKAGGELDYTAQDFKFPQNLRATLGYDHRLTSNWIATLEGIYTKGVNSIFYRNAALAGVIDPTKVRGQNASEGGRWIYGTGVQGTGNGNPDLVVPGQRSQIFEMSNQSGDYAYNLTAGLQRRYQDNFEASLFYTYSKSYDVQTFTSSTAFSQYRFGRAWGFDQNSKDLGRSVFEQNHRIVAYGTYSFPTHTDLSVQYFGESGTPYGYTVNGDPNGDGVTQNDPIYVPKNANDPTEIRFTNQSYGGTTYTAAQQAQAFESFIQSTKCLREQRGHMLDRNSCDNPFTNTVNVLVRQSFRTLGMQNLTLELGVFNFLNLVNKNWGIQPSAGFGSQTLLDMRGLVDNNGAATTDLVNGHPVYSFNPQYKQFLSNNLASNYQMQLSLRYSF